VGSGKGAFAPMLLVGVLKEEKGQAYIHQFQNFLEYFFHTGKDKIRSILYFWKGKGTDLFMRAPISFISHKPYFLK
jgi:hypothetical protein